MAASLSATLIGLQEEEVKNHHNQQQQHSPGAGASAVMASSPPAGEVCGRRKRKHYENPSPDAEVVALSPNTLLATNQFICEVCDKGFPREQNLQLHIRGHNLPWKLQKKSNHDVKKKIFICPEVNCVHHDWSRALADISGMKKHFLRKHREKKFSCHKCNKKYAVHSDWKAHDKICGTKDYTCECGSTFSRGDKLFSHRSLCGVLGEEVARHTTNPSPYGRMATRGLENFSNPGSCSMSIGPLIGGSHQQLSSPPFGLGASKPNPFTNLPSGQLVGSSFRPIQPPDMPLHLLPSASDFSGIHGLPRHTTPSNMLSFRFNGCPDRNSPQNDLNFNINNSVSGLKINAAMASAYNILNSTPAPKLSATPLLQKATLTGSNSNNAGLMKSMGSSLYDGMNFITYGGALGDGMSGGGSTSRVMYNNIINVGGGSTRGYRGGMEQMNIPYGGIMNSKKNADELLVGEVNNNFVVEPQMNVQNEYNDNPTRDFLGIGNGMNSLTGGGMVECSSHSEATISAEARPFVPGRPGF